MFLGTHLWVYIILSPSFLLLLWLSFLFYPDFDPDIYPLWAFYIAAHFPLQIKNVKFPLHYHNLVRQCPRILCLAPVQSFPGYEANGIFFPPIKGMKTILHVLGPKYKGLTVLFFQLELNWSVWIFWTFIFVILFLIHASVPLMVKFTYFYNIIWTPHLDCFYYGLWTESMCIF